MWEGGGMWMELLFRVGWWGRGQGASEGRIPTVPGKWWHSHGYADGRVLQLRLSSAVSWL